VRGRPNPELKAKCIRLREENRMSLREIHEATGASKGSLSTWLKSHPLTEAEQAERQKCIQRYRAPKKERGAESEAHRMTVGRQLSRNEKAKIAEAAVMFRATLQQFVVYGSPFDGDRADWIIEVGGKLWKVQVKWAQCRRGLPVVPLTHSPGGRGDRRYLPEDFDFIVGYDLYTDICHVWSYGETQKHKRTVTVRPEAAERWDKMRA